MSPTSGNRLSAFRHLLRLTLQDPRLGLRALLGLGLPQGAGLAALMLVAVVYALILQILHLTTPEGEVSAFGPLLATPFTTALVLFGIFAISALLIHVIGAARGGRGRLDQAFLTMAFMQCLMVIVQFIVVAAVFIIALLVPPLVPLLVQILLPGLVVLLFWLLTGFVTELHGFASRIRVFFGILISLFLVNLVVSLLLSAILGPEFMANV